MRPVVLSLVLAPAVLALSLLAKPSRPRIAVAGFLHESNSFNTRPTGLADFRISRGTAIEREFGESSHEIAGFLEGARRFGFDPVPALAAHATPAGPVSTETFEAITAGLIAGIRQAMPLDAVLPALHGAMVTPRHLHADAETVRRVRETIVRAERTFRAPGEPTPACTPSGRWRTSVRRPAGSIETPCGAG